MQIRIDSKNGASPYGGEADGSDLQTPESPPSLSVSEYLAQNQENPLLVVAEALRRHKKEQAKTSKASAK